jgi:cytochrome b pre-mRNA-processing protein 3
MLGFLFRGLTAKPARGAALFAALTATARQPHWYVEGKVPDTLDGRFCVLATLTAMTLARLEAEGEAGNAAAVALTERFIEVMESEHRELGLGDPTLGKTVRKLVGMLARRTELWRSTCSGGADWAEAVRQNLYSGDPDAKALRHSIAALKKLWKQLETLPLAQIHKGEIA